MLLEWNKDLIKQAERLTGSMPLHFATSWGMHNVMNLLLEADKSAAFLAGRFGLFPIHVTAFANKVSVVSLLLQVHLDCAKLHDGKGMTFLHFAILEESQSVVTYACQPSQKFASSSFINMQDDDGNTTLHLAVLGGNLCKINKW